MFVNLRRRLINWLAKDDITVILNTKVYDCVIEANLLLKKNCIIDRNNIVNFEREIDFEVEQRISLAKQGIKKYGKAFVLVK